MHHDPDYGTILGWLMIGAVIVFLASVLGASIHGLLAAPAHYHLLRLG